MLVIGIGNPAREDDGLGPAAAGIIEHTSIPDVTVDADYQPVVEDAARLAEYDTVVFVDASINGPEPFSFAPVVPERQESYSTHTLRPSGVAALARDLFDADAETYVLGIRGYSFNHFTETMTPQALDNLKKAVDFLIPVLTDRSFREAVGNTIDGILN